MGMTAQRHRRAQAERGHHRRRRARNRANSFARRAPNVGPTTAVCSRTSLRGQQGQKLITASHPKKRTYTPQGLLPRGQDTS